jgi:alpha-tubulin suppressor-like RCC1 family protein
LTNWSSVDASQYFVNAIKTNGTLWAWGDNRQGQLGQGTTWGQNGSPVGYEPLPVGILTNWAKISVNANAIGGSAAIKTDGTLWAWGGNNADVLGLGGATPSSPQQVGTLTNWSTVAVHGKPSLAIKTNGTLWSWGAGFYGALGLGNTTSYNSPKQVGSLTNWLSVASGGYNSIALSS